MRPTSTQSTNTNSENFAYLTEQLVTYIGNKRALLSFIAQGVEYVQTHLGKKKLVTFDVFSGSGIVSRFLKQHSSFVYANDLEYYASLISRCYLSNPSDEDITRLKKTYAKLNTSCAQKMEQFLADENRFINADITPGFISQEYAPKNLSDIQKGERCFYTPYNACYLDCMRQCIADLVPQKDQHYFIAPLLAEASIHANTGGVFKGFYKNSQTGIGKFGGNGENALSRIMGHIALPFPLFSSFNTDWDVFCQNANDLVHSDKNPAVDLAYIDPPYNQHPYGSNYFMLNLLAHYQMPQPETISKVSGIPRDWNRSDYNKRALSAQTFFDLVQNLNAKYLLISFNNEGFISKKEMTQLLSKTGEVTVLESAYNTYRASRNLSARNTHVKEYLYIVKKH
ncbi:MAG: DNA adenine methylase [Treponema sp.]|nr:DNA adenine methylase [Treponema sp.]